MGQKYKTYCPQLVQGNCKFKKHVFSRFMADRKSLIKPNVRARKSITIKPTSPK